MATSSRLPWARPRAVPGLGRPTPPPAPPARHGVGAVTGQPNRAQRRRAWPKRRPWCDRVGADRRLTTGAKDWLMLLARRSDDTGKPVWGNQEKMARELGRASRTVRRYRSEAEALGYVQTFRSKPERGRDGRWHRRKTNTYYLCLPSRETAAQGPPRRRQRAPSCVAGTGRFRPRHLADNDNPSTPDGVRQPRHHPPPGDNRATSEHPKRRIPPDGHPSDHHPEGETATEEEYRRPVPGAKAEFIDGIRRLIPKTTPTRQPRR
jgi:hypothetical protein